MLLFKCDRAAAHTEQHDLRISVHIWAFVCLRAFGRGGFLLRRFRLLGLVRAAGEHCCSGRNRTHQSSSVQELPTRQVIDLRSDIAHTLSLSSCTSFLPVKIVSSCPDWKAQKHSPQYLLPRSAHVDCSNCSFRPVMTCLKDPQKSSSSSAFAQLTLSSGICPASNLAIMYISMGVERST